MVLFWCALGCSAVGTSWEGGLPFAPVCDHPEVARQLGALWVTHPDYVAVGTRAPALSGIREVLVQRHEALTSTTRWCAATATWSDPDATSPVVWEMFATQTVLGLGWSLRPCFGARDPRFPDCVPK